MSQNERNICERHRRGKDNIPKIKTTRESLKNLLEYPIMKLVDTSQRYTDADVCLKSNI